MSDVEVAVRRDATIGESPWWDAATSTVGWVDIARGQVLLSDAEKTRVLQLGTSVGMAVPARDGGLLVAVDHALVELGPGLDPTGRRTVATLAPRRPPVRWNDGACDPRGRMWVGTMGLREETGAGALYRWDGHDLRVVMPEVSISNGIGWSPDASVMYYVDSPTRSIAAYPYDVETGEMEIEARRSIDVSGHPGMPDGLCVDVEGCLWVAFYDGGALRRLSPDGRVLSEIMLPLTRPTSCAFGGTDMCSLYITSARAGLGPSELAAQPLAGSLLVTRVPVPGVTTGRYLARPTAVEPSTPGR